MPGLVPGIILFSSLPGSTRPRSLSAFVEIHDGSPGLALRLTAVRRARRPGDDKGDDFKQRSSLFLVMPAPVAGIPIDLARTVRP
jgi:hypothetical protein